MFRLTACLIGIFLGSSITHAAEIATVLGRPDPELNFSKALIQERIELVEPSLVEESSTWVYSILGRKNVKSAVSVEVLNHEQATEPSILRRGLELAGSRAPVVLTTLGPIDNSLCKSLAIMRNVAFVIVAGNEGIQLDSAAQIECLARNILRVAAFDQTKNELMPFSNWGSVVRIAAPSKEILVTGTDMKSYRVSNTTVGSALVAARLAVFAENHSSLKGSVLIEEFLKANAERIPALEGKVEGSLALIDPNL